MRPTRKARIAQAALGLGYAIATSTRARQMVLTRKTRFAAKPWDAQDRAEVLLPFDPLKDNASRSTADVIASINNGDDSRYQQCSPRARVLRAIDDLIAHKVPKVQ